MSRLMIAVLLIGVLSQCKEDCTQSDKCSLAPDAGFCYAYIPKYYYDKEEKQCKSFIYGGCGGEVPFETLEACENGCYCDRQVEEM
ncbi:BPTI/Kunitz domain-containing protein [Reichenbachiella agarivorans]|uniref:BPTI/Kunitz domain-containing protein n=1 Tax=Reichenbachiella agarivorans TaxID=2979464 RepID=A0ABY6CJZ5_9BACT|nr:BPTI/Kunitz domain-containing protein [Reichenbachiella agarivorans]UXP30828.1 BPTI/Kunitz domain-containing protein [Reichenbachiella agarivorans]